MSESTVPPLAQPPRFLFDEDMAAAVLAPLPGGSAALFSARSPEKAPPNEDAAVFAVCDERRAILAVADGMGGQPAGETAARLALTELIEALADALREGQPLRTGILNGFDQANQAVLALGVGAATTLSVAEIEDHQVRPYHVGDSPVLLVGQRGRIRLQTVAHSPVGYAVEAGLLEARDALHHEDRHIVSNMVGTPGMRIEIGPLFDLRPRDTLLLASDGLFDNLHEEEIVARIRKGPLKQAMDALVRTARDRMAGRGATQPSKPDDLTIVLYRPQPLPGGG